MADVKMRCENCRYRIQLHDDGRLYFGCFHKPYNGEWVAKIERCPKEKENEKMKHYTESISPDLAKKLKEKGMPIEMQPLYAQVAPNARGIVKAGVGIYCPSYAMVFDWLMEKNIRITLHTYPAREPFAWGYMLWSMNGYMVYDPNPMPDMDELVCYPSWTEAADAAITKALELI